MDFTAILFLFFAVGDTLRIDRSISEEEPRVSVNEPQIEGRIANGYEAVPKDFRFVVSLRDPHSKLNSCGGVIISNRWILTAAHCTNNLTSGVEVSVGAWRVGDLTEPEQFRLFVHKKNIINHEKCNFTRELVNSGGRSFSRVITSLNDIALIKLPVVLEFNDYVQAVTLPERGESASYDNVLVAVPGWGKHRYGENYDAKILRFAEDSVLPNELCQEHFYPGVVTSTSICLNGEYGSSACDGDAGAPMVLATIPSTLIGIFSFGRTFCDEGVPSVFTRITSYLDWIESKTGLRERDANLKEIYV